MDKYSRKTLHIMQWMVFIQPLKNWRQSTNRLQTFLSLFFGIDFWISSTHVSNEERRDDTKFCSK